MQYIKTTTATNGKINTYRIKRIDDQPIQPSWDYEWEIYEGEGEILSAASGSPIVTVRWTESTDPGELFVLKCTVTMDDDCTREIGIRVKVITEVVVLTTSVEEYTENQCSKVGYELQYKATCENSTKIFWSCSGGQFKKAGSLVGSGPIQETPDGSGISTVTVVWDNSGPPFSISAYGADNMGNQSSTNTLELDILPITPNVAWTGPLTMDYGEGDAHFYFYLYDVLDLPDGTKNMGDFDISFYLYVGTLKEGYLPTADGNFEGDHWTGYTPYNLTGGKQVSEISGDTLTETYTIPIGEEYQVGDKTYYRLKWYCKIIDPTNPTCYIQTAYYTKDFEITWCPEAVAQGEINITAYPCPTEVPQGNITVEIPPCLTSIETGDIYIDIGVYDPQFEETPSELNEYDPQFEGSPIDSFVYEPDFVGDPTELNDYTPILIGIPVDEIIYDPKIKGDPTELETYDPILNSDPTELNDYTPILESTPVDSEDYEPELKEEPYEIHLYEPELEDDPTELNEYDPIFYGDPTSKVTYPPELEGDPIELDTYDPILESDPTHKTKYDPRLKSTPIDAFMYLPKLIGHPKVMMDYTPKLLKRPNESYVDPTQA